MLQIKEVFMVERESIEETEAKDAVHLSTEEVLSLLSRTIVIDDRDARVDEQEEL
jgi:hypothetical protein